MAYKLHIFFTVLTLAIGVTTTKANDQPDQQTAQIEITEAKQHD